MYDDLVDYPSSSACVSYHHYLLSSKPICARNLAIAEIRHASHADRSHHNWHFHLDVVRWAYLPYLSIHISSCSSSPTSLPRGQIPSSIRAHRESIVFRQRQLEEHPTRKEDEQVGITHFNVKAGKREARKDLIKHLPEGPDRQRPSRLLSSFFFLPCNFSLTFSCIA